MIAGQPLAPSSDADMADVERPDADMAAAGAVVFTQEDEAWSWQQLFDWLRADAEGRVHAPQTPPPTQQSLAALPAPARWLILRFVHEPPWHRFFTRDGRRVTVLGPVLGCRCDRCRWGHREYIEPGEYPLLERIPRRWRSWRG